MSALDELLREAVEWFPEGSQRSHDTSRVVHRLVAIVKRQRSFVCEGRIGADHVAAMKCDEDVERIAKGES